MRFKTAILLLFFCAVGVMAQKEYTYVDWQILRTDTVPAWYEEVIPLEEDFRNTRYEVRLEYPEYTPLSAEEAKRIAVWAKSLPEHPEVRTGVSVARKKGLLDVSFVPFVCRNGRYYKLMSFKMNIVRTPVAQIRATPVTRASAVQRYAAGSVLAQGRWVKIGITEDGVYRLTYADLQKMGFGDASRVKLYGYGGHIQNEIIDADADFDDLEEVPLYRDGKGLLFFGKGLVSWGAANTRGVATHKTNYYARQACYFLTEGDAPQAIQAVSLGAGARNDLTYTPANTLYKKEEFAWCQSGRQLFEATDYANVGSCAYHLPTIDPVSGSGAYLTVSFTASSNSESTVTPTVNGVSYNSIRIGALEKYAEAMTGTSTVSLSSLRGGTAGTDVNLRATAGVPGHLAYMELCYRRQLKMTTPYIYIKHNMRSASRFVIDTNGRGNVKLWRLGTRGVPMKEIMGTRNGNTYTVAVDDPTKEYVAVDVDADYPSPAYIGEVGNQNLHALRNLDMVIIVPSSGKLWAQAERLAQAHREMDDLRVQVVSAVQVYNEFSSGTPDATAYRRFMKMLYDRAETESDMPRYLLLFGDGVWDNRMISSATQGLSPDDYLLCYESVNSLSHTDSYVLEDYYGLLDDGEGSNLVSDKIDLGIGRFPVSTEAEAQIMVDKTIDYMQKRNAGLWRNVICVMGDDGDNNQHLDMAEQISKEVEERYPEMQVNRIYWDAYKRLSTTTNNTYPGAVTDIKRQMEDGCLMMNYVGHGNERALSHEFVLKLEDFSSFNSGKVPLWVTAACDVATFDRLPDNIGERAVRHKTGSAVAFYGTTRTVYPVPNSYMNRYFTRFVLGKDGDGRRNALGDAVRLAKVNLVLPDADMRDISVNKFHFVLLGDPALKLGKPEYRMVIERINDTPLEGEDVFASFKAGSMARIVGHIEDEAGNRQPDFQGTAYATVYDSESLITCLNNDGKSDKAFTFYTRDKKLYSGSDYVRNGNFDMKFPIPLDIKYSGEAGRVVMYAIDDDTRRDANGYSENVWVGGSSDELAGDHEGPRINAYLNREDFVPGGTVNPTPWFVATSEDQSGINTTSTAVGHDLELCIDGDPGKTYILNNEYENVIGDFTKGQLAYSIPALPDGQHTLTFRAWDVLNNSSTFTLDFNVDSRLQPELLNLTCTENPAREQTTFIVRYDRPGSECNFKLEVFDFAGRTLWVHTEKGTNADGIYPVTWNLTTSSGMPLSTGVYLYRVSVSTPESKAASRANKLVILRNK